MSDDVSVTVRDGHTETEIDGMDVSMHTGEVVVEHPDLDELANWSYDFDVDATADGLVIQFHEVDE